MFQPTVLSFVGRDPPDHPNGKEQDQTFCCVIIRMATMRTLILPLLEAFIQGKVGFDIVVLLDGACKSSPPDHLGRFFSMVNRFADYVNSFMHTPELFRLLAILDLLSIHIQAHVA